MEQPGVVADASDAGAVSDLRRVADRIESILGEIGTLPDPRAKEGAAELLRLLMDLYGAGLRRVLAIAAEAGPEGSRVVDALAEDDLVSSLLILHGLHPLDLDARVRRGLQRVQAILEPHGGRLRLVTASEAVVRVELDMGGHACGSSSGTMKLAVERAIGETAPEVREVDVQVAQAATAPAPVIQIQGLTKGAPGADVGPAR
jgi:Fe-S cluster biogenesis protein NfuA